MRRSLFLFCLAVGLGATGCGPSDGDNGGDGDSDNGGDVDAGDDGDGNNPNRPDARVRPDAAMPGTITGKVWAPNMAPGQALAGQEIPIFGALVYASTTKPTPIPQEVFCEPCVAAPFGSAQSSHDGSFTLSVDPGEYWLVIQKAQFRLEQRITVTPGQAIELTAAQTTLPSQHDPTNGAWVPRLAVVMGSHDHIEDILGKIGLGGVDNTGVFNEEMATEFDVYDNLNGGHLHVDIDEVPEGNTLLANIDLMRKYHIIFFSCSTRDLTISRAARQNIRQYVKEGGKIYVTDWSGEVMDHAFPTQVTLGDSGADTAGEYDPADPAFEDFDGLPGDSDGRNSGFVSNGASAVDDDLSQWLGFQRAPDVIDPDAFDVTDNYNWIRGLTPVQVGSENGQPIINEPKVWVEGQVDGLQEPLSVKHPLSVTFEPTGCGRVLYSTYQTSTVAHRALLPQERVLLYLIMEIGVCTQTVPPVD